MVSNSDFTTRLSNFPNYFFFRINECFEWCISACIPSLKYYKSLFGYSIQKIRLFKRKDMMLGLEWVGVEWGGVDWGGVGYGGVGYGAVGYGVVGYGVGGYGGVGLS